MKKNLNRFLFHAASLFKLVSSTTTITLEDTYTTNEFVLPTTIYLGLSSAITYTDDPYGRSVYSYAEGLYSYGLTEDYRSAKYDAGLSTTAETFLQDATLIMIKIAASFDGTYEDSGNDEEFDNDGGDDGSDDVFDDDNYDDGDDDDESDDVNYDDGDDDAEFDDDNYDDFYDDGDDDDEFDDDNYDDLYDDDDDNEFNDNDNFYESGISDAFTSTRNYSYISYSHNVTVSTTSSSIVYNGAESTMSSSISYNGTESTSTLSSASSSFLTTTTLNSITTLEPHMTSKTGSEQTSSSSTSHAGSHEMVDANLGMIISFVCAILLAFH